MESTNLENSYTKFCWPYKLNHLLLILAPFLSKVVSPALNLTGYIPARTHCIRGLRIKFFLKAIIATDIDEREPNLLEVGAE